MAQLDLAGLAFTWLLPLAAVVSLGLHLWQWLEARRFPLHRRSTATDFAPGVTLLKPLKGGDPDTPACLRSWLTQDYPGPIQVLFGVAADDDPACPLVRALLAEFRQANAELVVCPQRLGPNAKVSTLAQLGARARQDLWVISDADVRVPADFLRNLVLPFRDRGVGLAFPFYRLANPTTWALRCDALGLNADFWSSVLQARRLQALNFALGAVMAVRRCHCEQMGGFTTLADYLADDFELGRRVVAQRARLELCPVVVDCCEPAQGWRAVWRRQLRWSRTIRVCRPGSYAGSIISNPTVWPLLWLACRPSAASLAFAGGALALRLMVAGANAERLTASRAHWRWVWLAPLKDLLHAVVWALGFLGNRVTWRDERFRVRRNGKLAAA